MNKSPYDYLSSREQRLFKDFTLVTLSHKSSQIDKDFAREQLSHLNRKAKKRKEESMREINKNGSRRKRK